MATLEALDGVKDHYTCGNLLLAQLSAKSAFFSAGLFYVFNGAAYEVLPEDDIRYAIIHTLKERASSTNVAFILHRLAVELAAEPNTNPHLLAFSNGVFDLERGVLLKDVSLIREHRITGLMPFKYVPKALPPVWLNFLEEVFRGDEDQEQKVQFLQEWFGYTICRGLNFHKALVLYGDGGNGKSVVLDTLAAMVPKVTRLEWSEFGEQRGLERLADAWLNCSTEISFKETSSTTGFKKAVAQEILTANPKYKKPFDFTPKAKLTFATNGLPQVDDTSNGVFRRLVVLTFNNSFIGREDWELQGKLYKELPGLFNWAIAGYKRLVEQKRFTEVPSNVVELAEYRSSVNSLQSYFDDQLTMRQGDQVTFAQFYTGYCLYCSESNNRPFARNKMRGLIKQLGLPLKVYRTTDNARMVMALTTINY
jgi:putative DNA primase/helicase